jgi:hypothetical protein
MRLGYGRAGENCHLVRSDALVELRSGASRNLYLGASWLRADTLLYLNVAHSMPEDLAVFAGGVS